MGFLKKLFGDKASRDNKALTPILQKTLAAYDEIMKLDIDSIRHKTVAPHLLVLLATFGLHLPLQTYPYFRASYVVSVRRTKSLLTASFRFHLTMDTRAVRLYTSSLPRRVRDLHPLERAHGAQTKRIPSTHSPAWYSS